MTKYELFNAMRTSLSNTHAATRANVAENFVSKDFDTYDTYDYEEETTTETTTSLTAKEAVLKEAFLKAVAEMAEDYIPDAHPVAVMYGGLRLGFAPSAECAADLIEYFAANAKYGVTLYAVTRR